MSSKPKTQPDSRLIREYDSEPLTKGQKSQLRVGMSSMITPNDISVPDAWVSISSRPGLTISDAQWQEFEQAKRAIYVFYIVAFEDESHKNSYWKTTNCLYFVGTTAFWHNCADNRLDLISSK